MVRKDGLSGEHKNKTKINMEGNNIFQQAVGITMTQMSKLVKFWVRKAKTMRSI